MTPFDTVLASFDSGLHEPPFADGFLLPARPADLRRAAAVPLVIGMSSPVLLRGLEALVEDLACVRVAAAATSLERLLEACREVGEGVVLTDLALSRRRVPDLLADLKRAAPRMRAVLVADTHFPHVMRSAVQAGVAGLVCRDSGPGELCAALAAVADGRRYVAPAIGADLAEALTGRELTQREMQVLDLLSQGDCNKTIARQLDVTVGTVKTHVRAIMAKLESRSRTEAVHRAYRLGLVCIDA